MRQPLAIAALLGLSLAACGPSGEPTAERLPEDTSPTVPDTIGAPAGPIEAADDDCSTLTPDGICHVEYGMTAEAARAAFDGELYGDQPTDTSCYYLRPDEGAYTLLYMIVDGSVERIDVSVPGITTPQGAEVGMPLDDVEALYDTTERIPNKYMPDYEDVRVTLGDGMFAVFEEGEGGIVSAYRYGRPPAVDYVEGCA